MGSDIDGHGLCFINLLVQECFIASQTVVCNCNEMQQDRKVFCFGEESSFDEQQVKRVVHTVCVSNTANAQKLLIIFVG